MSDDARSVLEQAIAWHLRLPDAGADDWRAFTAWLEASAEHAAIYDALANEDAALSDALVPGEWLPRSDLDADARPDRWWGRWRWGVGGVGVAVAAGVAGLLLPVDRDVADGPLVFQTAPGVRHSVRLTDGTVVALNGGTRLLVARNDPRRVTLADGEALFNVVHDANRPFEVRVGDVRLQDVGTAFNVVRDRGAMHVQVAEGSVMFRPDADRLMLHAGDALAVDRPGGRPRRVQVATADVGGWRHDRLVFAAAPLPSVAAALTRSTGARIAIAPALDTQTFTGSLSVDGGAPRAVPQLARLLDIDWRRSGDVWTLSPRGHAPR